MYSHQKIEKKWQKLWFGKQIFKTPTGTRRKTSYILDMFPYPSGSGLHVGHPVGYTSTEIISRYLRLKGYKVLHPMGWDAFGLPAENYAIKTKIHPAKSTATNIKTFKRQLQELGFSYDWSREISTCNPSYYRWTQWFFSFLYRHGLAYKKKAPVNWCESCQTVLANEQVVDGMCDRSKDPVIQKELEQWFFKITDYIESRGKTSGLIKGLDKIDWPPSTKLGQLNWIGKKEGVIIHHQVDGLPIILDTFSAYPAWLFADTFLVIAPNHPLVPKLISGTSYEHDAKAFIAEVGKMSTQERNEDQYEKKGIFTGRYALDPFRPGEKMPVWIANFALMDFGTGIIRCSSHDVRDYEFAKKYHIALREVVDRVHSDQPVNAHENVGILKDSGLFSGKSISPQFIQEMLHWIEKNRIGKRSITYRIRDWLVSRQRYWGAPIPIVYDDLGKHYLLPDDELPVKLPTDVDFIPTGESPLVKSKSFHAKKELLRIEKKLKRLKVLSKDRSIIRRESDTMDTFVDSSWYMFRFLDPKNKKEFANKKILKAWGPVDLYVGGAEHTVLHLLYARFFTKALHEYGFLDYDEPFLKLRHQGLILGENGEKMSKSRGNVITTDEVVRQYGADTLRVYEMFMGPFHDNKTWSTKGVQGAYRFLSKVYRLGTELETTKNPPDEKTLRLTHQTLKKVGSDIEELKFNTAISQMMIFVNHLQELKEIPKLSLEILLSCLYPFAPHISEELWQKMGKRSLIMRGKWPSFDQALAKDTVIRMPVQVNGKLRATLEVPVDIGKEEALERAKREENVLRYTEGKKIVKEIFIPGRIINIVIR